MQLFADIGSEEAQRLLDLNEYIHCENKLLDYHRNHVYLVRNYAWLLNEKLQTNIDPLLLEFIALAHDLFKERALDKKLVTANWEGYEIPHDLNRYVRLNLDLLERLGLDDYFNTDIQLHPQAAGIFLTKELGVKDPQILYPVMFHSCPIIPVYKTLSPEIQTIVDIVMLADKLSSNYLKINTRDMKVRTDLDQIVFGESGNEFNYTLGLLVARLISQGNSKEPNSVEATKFYHQRLLQTNPLISKKINLRRLGGEKLWPKRKSLLWKTP